jgi:hypothetical protein
MRANAKPAELSPEPLTTTLGRLGVAIVFSIAFGYIEAAVVVYLREIFHPGGFTFPCVFYLLKSAEKQRRLS